MNEHVALKLPASDDDYDVDFSAWSLRQSVLIRERRFELVDVDNIAEEIESLARNERHSIEKRLRTLVEHLLKLSYFTLSRDPRRGWRVTVAKSRANIAASFRDSPSLYAQRDAIYLGEWEAGARVAALALADDPAAVALIGSVRHSPTISIDDALDPDFFPGD